MVIRSCVSMPMMAKTEGEKDGKGMKRKEKSIPANEQNIAGTNETKR